MTNAIYNQNRKKEYGEKFSRYLDARGIDWNEIRCITPEDARGLIKTFEENERAGWLK